MEITNRKLILAKSGCPYFITMPFLNKLLYKKILSKLNLQYPKNAIPVFKASSIKRLEIE